MAFLTDRGQTNSPSNGYFYIIRPNAGAPTGYDSFRISEENLFQATNDDIEALGELVSDLSDEFAEIQDAFGGEKILDQTSAFIFSQQATSTITKIVCRGASDGDRIKIGTSLGGDDIDDITFTTEYNLRSSLEEELDTRTSRDIHFTPVIGTVSVQIYFDKNTI